MAEVKIATAAEIEKFVNPATEKKFSPMVVEAIGAGHVLARWTAVKVSKDSSPNGKELQGPYIRLEAQNARGLAAMNNGKIDAQTPKPDTGDDTRNETQKLVGACDHHNYGFDLEVKQGIRVWLVGEAKGPEAAVKAALKGCLAMGVDLESVKTAPKFKAVPGIEKLVDRLIAEM